MMRPDQLEEAIKYRDRLKEIITFKSGLEDWDGYVQCHFGSYIMQLTMKCTKERFLAAVDVEERMVRNTLEILGVAQP